MARRRVEWTSRRTPPHPHRGGRTRFSSPRRLPVPSGVVLPNADADPPPGFAVRGERELPALKATVLRLRDLDATAAPAVAATADREDEHPILPCYGGGDPFLSFRSVSSPS